MHPVPESSCCPQAGMSHRLPAGWWVSMGVPAPCRGTEEEQTVTRECWETGLPSVLALPHPPAQGWLSMASRDRGGATSPSFSPSWLPPNADSPWARFLLVFSSSRFSCGAGLDQTGAPTPSPGMGDSGGTHCCPETPSTWALRRMESSPQLLPALLQ